jgi:choline dehydrogenase-like flavoprotein
MEQPALLSLSTGDRVATALVSAMIPAGIHTPSADPPTLLRKMDDWLMTHRLLRLLLSVGLWWLELRALTQGSRFSNLLPAKRQDFLKALALTPISSLLLRALSAPYKAAWLFDEDLQQGLGNRPPVIVPQQVEKPSWQSQITCAEDMEESQTLEADVVIIGTGAGGASAAYELACRGLAVIMVEEGSYYGRKDFNGRLQEVIPKLYRAPGLTCSLGNAFIPVPIGRNVGGTTTINSGTCMRTPTKALEEWQSRGIVGFGAEEMSPWFEGVEEMLQVTRADPRHVGEIGNVIHKGGTALGFRQMHPLPRNAPSCDGQGLCQFGCPTDAKRSTNVSYVPQALKRGAFLFTNLRAEKLVHDEQRITGLLAQATKTSGKSIRVHFKAPHVIVAAGTLMTPNFLKQNGVCNSNLGKHLTLHPCGVVNGIFPDRQFGNSFTIPQGYGLTDLADEGLMFEGGTIPLLGHGLLNNYYADDFIRFCEQYQNTGYFGFMIKDTSEGSVRRGIHRDVPFIHYHMNNHDFSQFKRGIRILTEIFLTAGATEVILPGPREFFRFRDMGTLTAWLNGKRSPKDFMMSAYHPLGTARIAATANNGVCDTHHQVFGWQGLYVMDGSSVPTSLGANPQVTIMAMAARAASRIANHP